MSKEIRIKIPLRAVGVLVLILSLLLVGAVAPAFIPTAQASPGWLAGWDKRVEFTIDHTDIDENLVWFPVLIHLSSACGKDDAYDMTPIFDEVGASYLKIAVTKADGTTQIYVEVDYWNATSEEAWLHVSRDEWSILAASDTTGFLYYDSTHANNTDYVGDSDDAVVHNVWDDNFKLVTHMRDGPDTSHVRDSTSNADYMAKKDSGEPAVATDGKIDDAQRFDGSDDYITRSSIPTLALSATHPESGVIVGDCLYIIFYGSNHLDKINLTTFTLDGYITLSATTFDSIASDGTHLYAASIDDPSVVVKVSIATFTEVANITLEAGEPWVIGSHIVGTDLYLGTNTDPGKIVKVDLITFTRTTVVTLNEGEKQPEEMDDDGTYLYFPLQNPHMVGRITLSTFLRESVISLPANVEEPQECLVDGNYVYITTRTGSANVSMCRVPIDSFVTESIETVVFEPDEDRAAASVKAGSNIYVFTIDIAMPKHITKVSISPFERVSSIELVGCRTEQGPEVLETANNILYACDYTSLWKIDIARWDSLVEMSDLINFGTGDFTLECWANSDTWGTGAQTLIASGNYTAAWDGIVLGQRAVDDDNMDITVAGVQIPGSTTLTSATWYYIAGYRVSGQVYTRINDTAESNGAAAGDTDVGRNFLIGKEYYDPTPRCFDGIIDEVRISNTSRTVAWLDASYESGRDHLLDFGSEEIGATTSVSATTCVTSHFTTTVTNKTTTTDEIVTTSSDTTCTSVSSTTCMSGTTTVDSTQSVDVTYSIDETVTVSVDETIYTTAIESTTISVTTCTSVHFTTTVTSVTTTTDEIVTTSAGTTCTSVSSTTCMTGTTTINTYTKSIDATHSIDESVTVSVDKTIYTTSVESTTTTISVTTCTSVQYTTTITDRTTIYNEIVTTSSDTTCTSVNSTTCMTGTTTISTYTQSIDATHSIDEIVTVLVDETLYAPGWWNVSWPYRVPIYITGSTIGDLTNYPVQFDLFAGSGVNSDNDIYTNGNAQSDYDDIRFVANDQITLYEYWLVDNYTWIYPDATVWVNVTSILISPNVTRIWAYWGNSTVSSLSDGSSVFPFFDDFLTDPDTNADWIVGEGTEDFVTHHDWYVRVQGTAASDGWSYIKGDVDPILADASTTYGWSMEWDQAISSNGLADAFPYWGAGLANDLGHEVLAFDKLYKGVSWYWHTEDPWANRFFYYCEWDAVGNIEQSNSSLTGWTYKTGLALPPAGWSRYKMTLFTDSSYVTQNGTELVDFDSLSANYLGVGQNPSYSGHGKAGDAGATHGYVNWVFMRPLADPEPTLAAGVPVDIDIGIHNMDCVDWVFEGVAQYIFYVNVSSVGEVGSDMSVGVGFFDGALDFNYMYYFSGTDVAVVYSPDDGISAILRDVETGTDWVSVNFTVMFNTPITDVRNVDLYVRWDVPSWGDSGWYVNVTDYFNIYNRGGLTQTETVGDGQILAGEGAFGFAATDATATAFGSSAYANITWRNLQYVGMLVHIFQDNTWDVAGGYWNCPTEHNNTGYVEYGISYCVNDTLVTGWKVRITIEDGKAGTYGLGNDHAWVALNISWYNEGVYMKSDLIYAFYEAIKPGDLTTQFALYIDLWFSDVGASSVVSGRVKPMYFGMNETGWGPWANWSPIHGLTDVSTFEDSLYDANSNIVTADRVKMMWPWSLLNKTSIDAGDPTCDNHRWEIKDYIYIWGKLRSSEIMYGIRSPPETPTVDPDDPAPPFAPATAGVWAELLAPLLTGAIASAFFLPSAIIDSVFWYFGISGFVAAAMAMILAFADNFTDAMTAITSLVVQYFRIISVSILTITDWLTRMISFVLTMGGHVLSIIDGTSTAIGGLSNMWLLMNFSAWVDAVPVFIFIWWVHSIDKRAKRMGGGWLHIGWGDLQMAYSAVSFGLDWSFRLFQTTLDMVFRLWDAIPKIVGR